MVKLQLEAKLWYLLVLLLAKMQINVLPKMLYYSSNIGPFVIAHCVDCNLQGLLPVKTKH